MKKITSIFMALVLALGLTACGNTPTGGTVSTEGNPEQAKLKIGILQLVEHAALDASREGFIKALEDNGFVAGENIEIDIQNAQGDQSNLLTMSQRFVNNKSDLILAIATGAAQSVASQTTDIPVLFTAVTDPVSAGLVASNQEPGGNLTGTNDMSPIKEQIDLLFELAPQTKTVGILFNSSEDNSVLQADVVKEILDEKGVKWVEQTVTNSGEVQQATQSIVSKCDAIYIPTDNVFASAMPIVGDIAMKAKIPVINGEENQVVNGGFATLGLNYFNLGYQTGEMAVRVLKGEEISKMPVESQANFDYLINKEFAEALAIEIPAHLQEFVK